MKKVIFLLISACLMVGMPSCKKTMKNVLNEISSSTGLDGSKTFDNAETLNSVKEMLLSKCDTEKMPIYRIFITEVDECSGRAQFVNVSMLNADKTQTFYQNFYFDGEAMPINDNRDSADATPINLSALDMNVIAKGIENAKELIPEGSSYKALRMLELGNGTTRLTIALTKDGEETVTSAGQTSEVYYDAIYEIDNKTGEATDKN